MSSRGSGFSLFATPPPPVTIELSRLSEADDLSVHRPESRECMGRDPSGYGRPKLPTELADAWVLLDDDSCRSVGARLEERLEMPSSDGRPDELVVWLVIYGFPSGAAAAAGRVLLFCLASIMCVRDGKG